MPSVRIAIQLSSFQQSFKQSLHTASQLGASAVEIDGRGELKTSEISDTGMRQLRKMLTDLNLQVASIGFRTRRGYDVVEDLDRRVEATKKAMRFAAALGARVVVNQIGQVPEDLTTPEMDGFRDVLRDLGKFGQHYGALLAAETGSEPAGRLVKLLESLPDGVFGIALNPGNLIVNGFEVAEDLPCMAPHILMVQANDGVRDLARGRGVNVPLGRGLVEFPEIMASLEERHYAGYYMIGRDPSANAISEISLAMQFLQNM